MKAKASDNSIINSGDTVLVREGDSSIWFVSLFSYKISDESFVCVNGTIRKQCIPLKGNEDLCGTANSIKKSYIPQFGDKVKGINTNNEEVTGILTFYNEEYSQNKYVVLGYLITDGGFTSITHVCKSVEPIKE